MPTIEELRAFIAACAERMSAIADTAATESRSAFDDGEQADSLEDEEHGDLRRSSLDLWSRLRVEG